VVYFAAQYNNQSKALGSARLAPGTMVIGVATATSLKGPWRTRVLHYPGQDNAVNGPRAQEVFGGDIDPGVVRDERTGRLYLFWAQQKQWIWEGALSPDGLSLNPHIAAAFGVSEPWECDAGGKKECVIEGPEPFYHDGRIYVMYSAASTWNASYSVGVASAADALDPTQPFVKYPKPILTTGNGFYGPGRTSHPVVGPGGQSLILYHALLGRITEHINSARTLMIGDLNWNGDWPVVNDGKAH
jgi:beta-xylosidase